MSTAGASFADAELHYSSSVWETLTLFPQRVDIARFLVAFCFVWPFFNYNLVDPGNMMEINFLPVFLAAALLPEIALREWRSILLSLPVFAIAAFGASPVEAMRVGIGIIPLHFLLNLARHLERRSISLLPPGLAYRVLQAFVLFSIVQTVNFQVFPVIPDWLTQILTDIVPRYAAVPYDDLGIRGVQGWASEPSGAAVICSAFALVAIWERRDRRWRVLSLLLLLVVVNKSIYSILLAALLGLCCILTLRRKSYALAAFIPLSMAAIFYIAFSSRLAELHTSILSDGANSESNRELFRFAQIFTPLIQFPHVYKPQVLFDTVVAEPLGLLPLVLGYGSFMGAIWLGWIVWRNFRLRKTPLRPFALVAAFIVFMITPPDLIPAVVALAVYLAPKHGTPTPAGPRGPGLPPLLLSPGS
jgi:hypothetical protein